MSLKWPQNKRHEERQELTANIVGIIKSSKDNLNKDESKAIKDLQKEKFITILPAEKGRATVILVTESYQKQMHDMLIDTTTY